MNLSHGAPVTAGWYFTQRLLSIPQHWLGQIMLYIYDRMQMSSGAVLKHAIKSNDKITQMH